MSTTPRKLLVVLGATGNQGGSIIQWYLSSPALQEEWQVRGVTRNTSSSSANALSASGIEMVAATLDDEISLLAAFKDATVIFAMTDFWQSMQDPSVHQHAQTNHLDLPTYAQQIEETWGDNIVRAAAQIPSLSHFIFSSLPPVYVLSNGECSHVKPFDGKARIINSIKTFYPNLWSKTSQIMIGHYNSNIAPGSYFSPSYNQGTKQFEMSGAMQPSDKIPWIDTPRSTGPFFWSLLHEKPGTVLIAFDDMKSRAETCEILERVTGRPFMSRWRSVEDMAKDGPFGIGGAEGGLWQGKYGFFGEKVEGWAKGLTWPKDLKEKVEVRTLEEWIREQDWSAILKQEQEGGHSA